MAAYNEFGSVPSFIFFEYFKRIGVNSSLNALPLKPSGSCLGV